jgi:hypothetical protein
MKAALLEKPMTSLPDTKLSARDRQERTWQLQQATTERLNGKLDGRPKRESILAHDASGRLTCISIRYM